MNWALLGKMLPTAVKVMKEIVDGFKNGRSNQEIRDRIASSDLILDEELDDLRDAETDLEDFIRTGG